MHHNYILPFLDATGRPGSGGLAVIIRLAHAHTTTVQLSNFFCMKIVHILVLETLPNK